MGVLGVLREVLRGRQKDTKCYFAETVPTEELQEALVSLELSSVAVVTPVAVAEDGELGEHEAHDSTDSQKVSAEDGLMGVTTKDGPEDLPVKDYLDATVVPVLRDGLRILAKERWAWYSIPSYIHCGKIEMASQVIICRTWLQSKAVDALMHTGQKTPTPSWETTSRHTERLREIALRFPEQEA